MLKNNPAKSILRNNMKQKRDTLSLKERRDAMRTATANAYSHLPLDVQEKIGIYWPLGAEMDTKLLIEMLLDAGHVVALPAIEEEGKPLIFRQYVTNAELVKNPKTRTQEPTNKYPEIEPQIIIVPLLAFDESGNRLGFGGGYYDRTIKKLSDIKTLLRVGFAYDFQKVASVPAEMHDEALDCVVTDKQVYVFD